MDDFVKINVVGSETTDNPLQLDGSYKKKQSLQVAIDKGQRLKKLRDPMKKHSTNS